MTKLSRTALGPLYGRVLAGIPYAKELWNEVSKNIDTGINQDPKYFHDPKWVLHRETRHEGIQKRLYGRGSKTLLVDVAAGLASRGLIHADKGNCSVDVDLPEMIDVRKNLLDAIGYRDKNLQLVSGNALDGNTYDEIADIISRHKNTHDSVTITTEALMLYLSKQEKARVIQNTHHLAKVAAKHGMDFRWLLTHLTPQSQAGSAYNISQPQDIGACEESMIHLANNDNNYKNEQELLRTMKACGFRVGVHLPSAVNNRLKTPKVLGLSHTEINKLHIPQSSVYELTPR